MSRPLSPSHRRRVPAAGPRRLVACVAAIAVLVLGGAVPAHAETSGTVRDEAFADRVAEGFEGGVQIGLRPEVHAVLPMADGGFVVGGSFATYRGQPAPGMARLTADLELDTAFMARLGSGFDGQQVNDVAAMPDGGFVVATGLFGSYQGQRHRGLVRLTPELTADPGLAADLGSGVGNRGGVSTVVPMPDGGFVITGTFESWRGEPTPGGMIRLDDRLQIVPEFSAALGAGFNAGPDRLAQLPDGGWLAAGNFSRYQGQAVSNLVRLTSGLELATDAVAPLDRRAGAITVLPDGGALVAGQFTTYGNQPVGGVIRLDARMRLVEDLLPATVSVMPAIDVVLPMADGSYLIAGTSGGFLVDGRVVRGLARFVPATVALGAVPDQDGHAGVAGTPVQLAATRSPTWLPDATYSATGLPEGVGVDASTGLVTGTPTTTGTYRVELAAHLGSITDVLPVTWEVRASQAPALSGRPDGAVVGTPYEFRPTVSGAPAPTVTVLDGALPDGLTLDPGTGLISGVPSVPGTFRFTLTATNGVEPGAEPVEMAIEVQDVPAVAEQAPAVPAAPEVPAEPVVPAAPSVPAHDGSLAVTGSAVGAVVGAAAALLATGLLLALGGAGARRRAVRR